MADMKGGRDSILRAGISAAKAGLGPFRAAVPAPGALREMGPAFTGDKGPEYPVDVRPPAVPNVDVVRDLLANITAGNVATPNLLKGSQAVSSDLNTVRLASDAWMPVTIDRPEIWVPRVATSAPVWYTPNRQPTVLASTGEILKSTRYGVVYLPTPGTWWLRNTDLPLGTAVEMFRIDAFQPGVVSKYLSDPGVHNCAHTQTLGGISNAGVVSTAIAANRDRVGLTIQNNTFTSGGVYQTAQNGSILLTMSKDVTNAALDPTAVAVGSQPFGIVLVPGASITWSGDNNCKQALRVTGLWIGGTQVTTYLDLFEYV